MTDCVYFLLYLALGKLSLMLLINYLHNIIIVIDEAATAAELVSHTYYNTVMCSGPNID